MLSGIADGDFHHTLTESHILPIDVFMRLIYAVSVCDIAANVVTAANIVEKSRFI